ncbi:hypothetical protein OG892_37265 [Streptomyces sp. NBC_00341]|uniref:hypothetical protein n=1 Tax=Streptomyces sp. NBC_00341 TaxID=2975717 RepID=UPI00308BE23A|nr:hypothetical protein OG892_37265 [Streptomyces sp. NBC_00341]
MSSSDVILIPMNPARSGRTATSVAGRPGCRSPAGPSSVIQPSSSSGAETLVTAPEERPVRRPSSARVNGLGREMTLEQR